MRGMKEGVWPRDDSDSLGESDPEEQHVDEDIQLSDGESEGLDLDHAPIGNGVWLGQQKRKWRQRVCARVCAH